MTCDGVGLHVILERLHIIGAARLRPGGAGSARTDCAGKDGTSTSQSRQQEGRLRFGDSDWRHFVG